MSEKKYNIHNLVLVTVKKGVNRAVENQIDFQIGYFENKDTIEEVPYEIDVLPYKFFTQPNTSSVYNGYQYDAGFNFYSSKERFAIIKSDHKLSIYTETPFLINLFIQLLVYKDGYSFIHAAGVVDSKGSATLFPASGGVGKTAILGNLMKKGGYKLLGDDLVLIHRSGKCLSFPRPFILKEYHRETYSKTFRQLKLNGKNSQVFKKFFKAFLQNMPLYYFVTTYLKRRGLYGRLINTLPLPQDFVAAVPVADIFGNDSIHTGIAKIKKVIYMERGSTNSFNVSDMDSKTLSSRMFSVIHDEWHEYMQTLLSLGATELVELPNYFSRVSNILHDSILDCERNLLKIPKSASPEELYDFYEKQ